MRIFYILSCILLLTTQAQAQSTASSGSDRSLVSRIIKFYPNPASSIINFDFQKDYNTSLNFQIFSFVGKKVLEINNVTPRTVVNLTEFYRGIYIFQLRDRNGKIIDSGKFQVSK
ncbi:MAG TPA: T9SS type A sorting domain-containing protein [Flavitalea sp.]|nr:T9SS type A sorting domain-containing protein [Flavitalea sp.]